MPSEIVEWAEREIEIACKREAPNRKDGEWDYGCACYESALKAYKSLAEDGHSGFSFSITKQIFDRLCEGKPLTPIEDTPDIWNKIAEDYSGVKYQCKRMSSLFKTVHPDGKITYNDINYYCCVNIDNTTIVYYNGLVEKVVNELFPITMPYIPEGKYKVFCEDFLTDPKNGDFDTIGIFELVRPNGEKISINRFFKVGTSMKYNGWDEINLFEYRKRKEKRILPQY